MAGDVPDVTVLDESGDAADHGGLPPAESRR